MDKRRIVLSEGQIEHIINGGEVTVVMDDLEIIISESLIKDVMVPVINHRMQVVDVQALEIRKPLMNNTFNLGC